MLSFLHEPDVALTDYGLAVESVAFAWMLMRGNASQQSVKRYASWLFLALAASSILGGSFHGFFPFRTQTTGGYIIWISTMLSIGLTAVALWLINLRLLGQAISNAVGILLLGLIAVYAMVLLTVSHMFLVGIVFYLVPLLVFLAILCNRFVKDRSSYAAFGIIAIVLMLLAAVLQQLQIGLPQVWLNHNAVYHVLQAVALGLLFLTFRRIPSVY